MHRRTKRKHHYNGYIIDTIKLKKSVSSKKIKFAPLDQPGRPSAILFERLTINNRLCNVAKRVATKSSDNVQCGKAYRTPLAGNLAFDGSSDKDDDKHVLTTPAAFFSTKYCTKSFSGLNRKEKTDKRSQVLTRSQMIVEEDEMNVQGTESKTVRKFHGDYPKRNNSP
uniref:Uncharacterized protein n=1 Tax=Romanomermis culicivorax TaxID=13658 RepID=A0A915LBB9_ROMCU